MRGAEIYISVDTMRRLRAFSDLMDIACVDAAAELLLTKALESHPAIDDLISEQRRVREEVRMRWKESNKPEGPVSEPT